MKCPKECGEMIAGELLWVCGWCGATLPRKPPSPASSPKMVEIPDGTFRMGSSDDDLEAQSHEKPMRTIALSHYWISIHAITNGQYHEFIKATGREAPVHWKTRPPVGENSLHPVCFVSWYGAVAYCEWFSQHSGRVYTLPTEAQWEKAARGGIWLDGDDAAQVPNPLPERRFPHGNEILPEHANFDGLQGGTTKVGAFRSGASPYGCLDMAGNVSEWCLDTYHPESHETMQPRDPYRSGEGKKVLRGGSWRSGRAHVRCANRYFYHPDQCSYGIGFRIVSVEER